MGRHCPQPFPGQIPFVTGSVSGFCLQALRRLLLHRESDKNDNHRSLDGPRHALGRCRNPDVCGQSFSPIRKKSQEVEIKVSHIVLLSPSFLLLSNTFVKKKKVDSPGVEINFFPVAIPFSDHQGLKKNEDGVCL